MLTVKKYSNRRLYDTAESRYITLEELADRIRDGSDVQVLDAKSGEDLTAATLTQIIIDGRGAARLFPVALLTELVRMQDDVLAEFLGKFMSGALDLFLAAKRGLGTVASYVPLSAWPYAASDAMARLLSSMPLWGAAAAPAPKAPLPGIPDAASSAGTASDIAELRRELEELKRAVGRQRRGG